MHDRPLIVLSLEGLTTSALGCYGSSWNSTPAIDAIAASGCLWDRWIATSDDPLAMLRDAAASDACWASARSARGGVELFTDVSASTLALDTSCFDRIVCLACPQPTDQNEPVEDVAQSQFGQLVAAAIQRDWQDDPWGLLWLHSNFLTHCWDAPRSLFPIDEAESMDEPSDEVELLELETELAEPLQPLAPIFDTVVPPRVSLDEEVHPDLVTSWMRTYGCQVRLLDLLVEVLLNSLQCEDPTILLMGTSGFRLGQGGKIGHLADTLRSPDIRVPMMISDHGPLRIPALTSSDSLSGLLDDLVRSRASFLDANLWRQTEQTARVETRSERAIRAVTMPGWFYVQDQDSSEHLFLKPDDVEDFNDVGRIRTDVIKQMNQVKKNKPC